MYEFSAADLTGVKAACRDLDLAVQVSQPIAHGEFLEKMGPALEGLRILCGHFHADAALIRQISELEETVGDRLIMNDAILHAQLSLILSGIQENLESRKFMFIPADQAVHYNNAAFFGKDAWDSANRDARIEMLEAGNCYAAALGTACVFHCMRVAEHGLRRLARKLRITISDKGRHCPIEFGEWDKVITQVKNKIADARTLAKGPRRERRLHYYSDLADHCAYMKDIWRNEVSHARRRYNKAETLGVMTRVRDFLRLLANPPK